MISECSEDEMPNFVVDTLCEIQELIEPAEEEAEFDAAAEFDIEGDDDEVAD